MTKSVASTRGNRSGVALAALALVLTGLSVAGCNFQSELGGAECDRENARSDDGTRRCKNGFWVRVDTAGGTGGDTEPVNTEDTLGGDTGDTDPGTDTCAIETEWYDDEDGDGYGAASKTRTACRKPPGYVAQEGDCDDENPDRHPDAGERCNNEDDNCDGNTDEMLTRECGACNQGTETCMNGTWGDCVGGTQSPPSETCDGVDNDCDGNTDENLERSCGKSQGICEEGTETCTDGSWGKCKGNTPPEQYERCDQKDRDCDGSTDNGTCKGVGDNCAMDLECASGNCVMHNGSQKCRQTIFVTAQTAQGNFASTTDADTRCENAAHSAGLGLSNSWTAVISDGNTSGRNRPTFNFPIYNTNGDQVATSSEDLWDNNNSVSLQNPVLYDASGNRNATDVWTGTQEDGGSGNYCDNNGAWNTNDSDTDGTIGRSDTTDSNWVKSKSEKGCDHSAALYCVQDP